MFWGKYLFVYNLEMNQIIQMRIVQIHLQIEKERNTERDRDLEIISILRIKIRKREIRFIFFSINYLHENSLPHAKQSHHRGSHTV